MNVWMVYLIWIAVGQLGYQLSRLAIPDGVTTISESLFLRMLAAFFGPVSLILGVVLSLDKNDLLNREPPWWL